MPVRLDQVPAQAPRPAQPRAWLWIGLLPVMLMVGTGLALLFSPVPLHQQPHDFWALALGVPLAGWCVLSFGKVLLYMGQQSAADGWDEAREKDLARKTRRGRRSQQVLGVSLYTALRKPGDQPAAQLDALLNGTVALEARSAGEDAAPQRYSQLPGEREDPEHLLLDVLTQVLGDLAQTLAPLPDNAALALLLEVESGLSESDLRRVWRKAWSLSGIRQSASPVEGRGLVAVDHWLDQRIDDQALLMVVAVHFAPDVPDGTTEVAVGLLFGNRLTQSVLPPIAYLHRPEQDRKSTREGLLCAARQALAWTPQPAQPVEQVWRTGIDAQRQADLAAVLADVSLPAETCNLDELLGHPGPASPWLAIAAAAQTIERGAGSQFIFSGGDVADGLWSTVLIPVSSLSK
ncbi:hypothetical protein KW849_30630 [Pseudomonas sp. PDM26]|uniref:hypothetical protein n=1 Tax=Pseudomonas sp. PDM26 TaxID=2854766 RepID=UPI001C454F42|nr:hypothetical protein [Pseudomonas sp. PDM26]MBV7550634.1 hypothetical protein [Pseudomonas sp. PDM26]